MAANFDREYDGHNAIVTIHAGAGGVDAADSYDAFLSPLAGHATLHHLTQIGLPAIPPAAYSGLVKAQAAVLAYADNSKWVAFSALFNIPLIFLLKPPPKNA